jgi:hypothetical protein
VTGTTTDSRRRWRLEDGRVALVVGLTLLAVLGIGLVPTILREQTRDWIAYDQAAMRLASDQPLYVFELPTPDDEYYLYPPPTAAAWVALPSPEALLALKMVALVAVGALAAVAWPGADDRSRLFLAAALAGAALVAASNVHDLVLGNVMALYVGAVAVSLARPGWLGALPLGFVCAAALKPVIGPYLLWLVIRRRDDALRVGAVVVVVSVVVAAVIGPDRYVEYLVALPQMSVLVDLPTGNVGLAAISREFALLGVAAAYLVTIWAAIRLDIARAAAIAIAAGLVAQPTIGFNYAGLLLPAVLMLWSADRRAGFIACIVVPLVALVSPPIAAATVVGLAVSRLGDRPPSRSTRVAAATA